MKSILVTLLIVVLAAACKESAQSTEVKTDSTAVVVDSTLSLTDTVLVDSVK